MSLIPNAGGATPDTGAKASPAATPGEGAGSTPPAGGSGAPPVVTPAGDWYYADGLKGDGAKPDWMKDKYKTVTDQAKAYADAEKRLGAFKGAPEGDYDLTIDGQPDLKFSAEDPLLKDFLANAKENGVSQEYVSELLGVYAQALTANMPDSDAEMKRIGVNAEQDLQVLAQWAGDILTPEEFGIFKNMVVTADAFKVFDKLRNSGITPEVAPEQRVVHESKDQVLALISDPRYDTDPAFRDDVRKKLSVAMAREGGKK